MANICGYTKMTSFVNTIQLQNVINSSRFDLFTLPARQYQQMKNYSEEATNIGYNAGLQCS